MRARTGTAGQVLPFIALTLGASFGFSGMAVDAGFWEYRQQAQQTAADAAAIAGAQTLVHAGCPGQSAAQASAYADAAQDGFGNGNNVSIAVQNPPASGPYSSDACAVLVRISTQAVPSFFARLFSVGSVTETTQSIATVSQNNGACIYMLNPQASTNFQSTNIQVPQCSMVLNGTANFNGSTVDTRGIGEGNYGGSNNGGTFADATPAPVLPEADPCSEISGCAYLTANPPSTSSCGSTYSGGSTMGPGCYNNLNLNSATVTMSPGLYVLAGGSSVNMASITGSGVTIYIPAGATTNFNKAKSMTLTPPASGNYTGVTYYQAATNTGTVNLNGAAMNISGLVYAPTAQLNFNGAQGNYTLLVAAYANLNYSSGEDYGSPAVGQSLIRTAVLGE